MLIISSPLPHHTLKGQLIFGQTQTTLSWRGGWWKNILQGEESFRWKSLYRKIHYLFYTPPPIFIFYCSFLRKALGNLCIHQSKSIIGRKLFKYWCRSQCPAPCGIGLIMNLQLKRMMGHHLLLITNYDIVDTWISNLKQHTDLLFITRLKQSSSDSCW